MNSFLFLGIFSAQVSLARAGLVACTNAGCPEGYFCHENVCKRCLKCDLLFRKGNFCVIDFNDCKECLTGYKEMLITNFSNVMKPCKPVKKKIKLNTCESDSNCPLNNYCNDESCIKCFDCSLLNRVPPIEKCAKGLNECGSCMMGFHEVSVTTKANHKPCEKDILIIPEISNSVKTSFVTIAPVFALIMLIFTAAVILRFKQLKERLKTKVKYHRPIYPSAPPLYSMNTPEYVRKTDGIQPITLGYLEEKKQQARVFRAPSASYYIEEEADQLNNTSSVNNGRTTPSSYTHSNRDESDEISSSSRTLLDENSELALNEFEMDSLADDLPNENTVDENNSREGNSVALDVNDVPRVSEDSSGQAMDSSPGSQNLNQEQT